MSQVNRGLRLRIFVKLTGEKLGHAPELIKEKRQNRTFSKKINKQGV